MGRWYKLSFWLGTILSCLMVTYVSYLQTNNSISSKSDIFKEDIFNGSQYFFAKQGKLDKSFDLNILQGVFIKSSGPPFLIKGKTFAVLGEIQQEQRQTIEYIVEKGDTLSSLAKKFNISTETIVWANNLNEKSTLKVGQKLSILPVSGVLHLVKKGETISQIAQIYQSDSDKIVKFNHLLNEDDIFIGDLLIVPDGKKPRISNPDAIFQVPLTDSYPLSDSYFIFPTEGKITQTAHGYFNNAVDIANRCGNPVVAVASGEVQRAERTWVGGKIITILHSNGIVSYYGHLSKILVDSGQKVLAGDIIGYIGNTGYTLGPTGCHLHFDIRGAKNFLLKYPIDFYLKWETS